MSFEAGGRTFTGCTVESFAATARGSAGCHRHQLLAGPPRRSSRWRSGWLRPCPAASPVRQAQRGSARADGLATTSPRSLHGMQMKPYRELNLSAAGGCCGTTPEFIQLLNGVFAGCKARPPRPPHEVGHLFAGELRQCGRHHGGGRAHQSHRQKAVPTGPLRK